MKFAVCVVAYQEEDYIKATLNSFPDDFFKLVLISTQPWYGERHKADNTLEIANKYADEVILGTWSQEHEQRNHGLDILKEYDYVWCVDGDELWDYNEVRQVGRFIKGEVATFYQCQNVRTYWKTTDYEITPQDDHSPVVLVDPKKERFTNHRNIGHNGYVLPKDLLTMYHLSYVHDNEKIKQKLDNFSHADGIFRNWFGEKWLKWTEETKHLHPYTINKWYMAKRQPLPKHIKDLI